jgi:hypothetical protein
MSNGATAIRLAMTAVLTLALLWGWHRSEHASPSSTTTPFELSQIAAAAMKKARHWHSDAILVKVEVKNDGAQSEKIFKFYAPSDNSGYIITSGIGHESEQAVGAANWGTIPIPVDFPDLSEAIKAMRARGMNGGVRGGTLTAVKLCGPKTMMRWEILLKKADQPDIKSYDVYFNADPPCG